MSDDLLREALRAAPRATQATVNLAVNPPPEVKADLDAQIQQDQFLLWGGVAAGTLLGGGLLVWGIRKVFGSRSYYQ